MRTLVLIILMMSSTWASGSQNASTCIGQYIDLAKKRAKINKGFYITGTVVVAAGVGLSGPFLGSIGGAFLLFGAGSGPFVGMGDQALKLGHLDGFERTKVFKRLELREVETKEFSKFYKQVHKRRPNASVDEVIDLLTDGFQSGAFCAEKTLMNKKDILHYVVSKL